MYPMGENTVSFTQLADQFVGVPEQTEDRVFANIIPPSLTIDANIVNIADNLISDFTDNTVTINNIPNVCCSISTAANIDSYEKAMNFKNTHEGTTTISQVVLAQLVDRIKELEELNAKNWTNILEGDKE